VCDSDSSYVSSATEPEAAEAHSGIEKFCSFGVSVGCRSINGESTVLIHCTWHCVAKLHASRPFRDFTPPFSYRELTDSSTELLRCEFWAVFTRLLCDFIVTLKNANWWRLRQHVPFPFRFPLYVTSFAGIARSHERVKLSTSYPSTTGWSRNYEDNTILCTTTVTSNKTKSTQTSDMSECSSVLVSQSHSSIGLHF
jgi:hypothetical protein